MIVDAQDVSEHPVEYRKEPKVSSKIKRLLRFKITNHWNLM